MLRVKFERMILLDDRRLKYSAPALAWARLAMKCVSTKVMLALLSRNMAPPSLSAWLDEKIDDSMEPVKIEVMYMAPPYDCARFREKRELRIEIQPP